MLKKLENNDIGATSYVERTFMYVVIFCLSIFALDVILFGVQMLIANHQLNYVAKKCEFQNGFLGTGSTSDRYGGYWSNGDFMDYLDGGFAATYGENGTIWNLSVCEIKDTSYSQLSQSEYANMGTYGIVCGNGDFSSNSYGATVLNDYQSKNNGAEYLNTGVLRLRFRHSYRLFNMLEDMKFKDVYLYKTFSYLFIDYRDK